MCDARTVDWTVVAFIGALAIFLAIAVALALTRGRELEAIRELTEGGDAGDELAARVRRLQGRLTASEVELDQQARNASFLADLMGIGVLRVDDSLRVELTIPAAHVLLGHSPGSIIGRSAM